MRNDSKGKVKPNLNMIEDLRRYLSREDINEINSIGKMIFHHMSGKLRSKPQRSQVQQHCSLLESDEVEAGDYKFNTYTTHTHTHTHLQTKPKKQQLSQSTQKDISSYLLDCLLWGKTKL